MCSGIQGISIPTTVQKFLYSQEEEFSVLVTLLDTRRTYKSSTSGKKQHTFGGLFGPGGEAVEMEGSPANLTVPDPVSGTDYIPADHAIISRVGQSDCQSLQESTIFFDLVHKGSRCARSSCRLVVAVMVVLSVVRVCVRRGCFSAVIVFLVRVSLCLR